MYNPDITIIQEDYIITNTNNIICREADVHKPQALEIPNGRVYIGPKVTIHADLAPVQINKYSFIDEGAILKPGDFVNKDGTTRYITQTIGSHTYIGTNCTIEAAAIGMGCFISKNCIISKRVILKDYVLVLENTVICCDMVIPPFSIVSGNPGVIIGEQSESASTLAKLAAEAKYKSIKPIKREIMLMDIL